jgi:acyl carrier protein
VQSKEQQLMDVAGRITALLGRMYRLAPAAVVLDAPLYQLHIDSLALEELRLVLEDELHIDLEDVHLTSRNTVQQLLDIVCAKAAA